MTTATAEETERNQPSASELFGLVAVAALLAASQTPSPMVAATAAVVGLGLLALYLRRGPGEQSGLLLPVAGVLVAILLLLARYSRVGPLPAAERVVRPLWEVLVLIGAVALFFVGRNGLMRRVAVASVALAALLVTITMTVAEWNSDVGFDVYHAHQAAGQALLAGDNPYGPAVQIPNGSPFATPGSTIDGYTYPPVVLFTYGAVSTVADPRLVSLVAWAAVLIWLGKRALSTTLRSDKALAIFILVAAAPVWPVVWFASWTEPLSIAFFAVFAVLWRRRPWWAAVALGLAVASKQYFVFLAPLLLLHSDLRRPKVVGTVLGVAALTFVPFLLVDPKLLWSATVGNIAGIGFRPDTQSLSGLLAALGADVVLPRWAWLASSSVVAVILSVRGRDTWDFLLRAGLTIGFAFVAGLAFPNYWFLVAALVSIGLVIRPELTAASQPEAAP